MQHPNQSPVRILLVEGNPDDVRSIQDALSTTNQVAFALSRVGRLDEALEWLAKSEVDLVLLDLRLPDSAGLETLDRLGSDRIEPVVVISDDDDEAVATAVIRAGAQDHVPKSRMGHDLPRVILHAIERKRSEEARRARERSQMMDAVGRLAGGIAHDFNNMLTAIIGHADLLAEALAPEQRLSRDVAEIKKAAKRASDLTNQLLAFSRQQVLEMVVVDPERLITDLERILHRVVGDDIQLELSLARDLGRVRGDPGQLEQVIVNLVLNARDALPNGGRIVIAASNIEFSGAEPKPPALPPGRYLWLQVIDNGKGMDRQTAARVFEPFFTTKEQGAGDGLGLSTVHGIVKQHGGDLTVRSQLGQGTTFSVYLPRIDSPAQPESPSFEVKDLSAKGETVLVAEDDEMLLPLIKGALIRKGYTVVPAPNGEQALELARRHQGKIDLLVTDVVLPGMSGRELAKRLIEDRPDTRVLYISGHTGDPIVTEGGLEGARFLPKPFTPTLLAAKVREALADQPAQPGQRDDFRSPPGANRSPELGSDLKNP